MLKLLQKLIRWEWPVRLVNPLMGRFNPFLPEFRENPYPVYRKLREAAPVYFSSVFRGWILTRYSDIESVLQNPEFSVDRTQAKLFKQLNLFGGLREDFAEAVLRSLLMLDPPDHTRIRKLVVKAFTPRRVDALRPRIQGIVDDLLDQMAEGGEADLIPSLANPLPVTVISEMLGVPTSDHVKFKQWSDALTALLDPFQASGGMAPAEQAFVELSSYLHNIFDQRRREPEDDMISALVAVEDEGDVLSESELLSLTTLILAAGHETTTNLIGNAVLALINHPQERARLQADSSMVKGAVEEFLRYDSPVQTTDRVATRDCEIGGKSIKKGAIVGLLLGSANHDPAEFDNPDQLNIDRKNNHHLAFSHGAHFCLGAQLARAETEIVISSLLNRFPNFSAPEQEIDWKRSIVLRGPMSLRLKLEG